MVDRNKLFLQMNLAKEDGELLYRNGQSDLNEVEESSVSVLQIKSAFTRLTDPFSALSHR